MPEEKWACVRKLGAHGLRRGSWYAVADDSHPDEVVLDVSGRAVRVDRSCVTVAASRPLMWSVVREDPPQSHLGARYGVCPNCVARAPLNGDETELSCAACGFAFPVDWSGLG